VLELCGRQSLADAEDLDANDLTPFVEVENHARTDLLRLHDRRFVKTYVECVSLFVETYSHSFLPHGRAREWGLERSPGTSSQGYILGWMMADRLPRGGSGR
jgi:hypothetical protein